MKKLIVLLSVLVAGNAFAFGIPSIGGFGDADTSAVTKRAQALEEKVGTATISLAEGLADVLELSGKVVDAASLRARISDAKSSQADSARLEALSSAIGAGQKSLAGAALGKMIPVAAAQAKLPSALFNISSAIATDLSVAKDTADLAQEIPKIASKVKNPMKLKELTDALGAVKFVASQILPQAQSMVSLVSELSAYASANNIKLK